MLFDAVKTICKEKKLSIYKLEKEANLSKGSVCKWNNSIPSADKLQRVAKILKIKADTLLEFELDKDKEDT